MKSTRKLIFFILIILLVCASVLIYERMHAELLSAEDVPNQNQPKNDILDSEVNDMGYRQITMEEAKTYFAQNPGSENDYLIVDVRRPDEFAEGHLIGAINVPNETISDIEPEKFPDKTQVIFIYCRSGNRSKVASEKLAALGYVNIIEFGGIIDWTGEIEKIKDQLNSTCTANEDLHG